MTTIMEMHKFEAAVMAACRALEPGMEGARPDLSDDELDYAIDQLATAIDESDIVDTDHMAWEDIIDAVHGFFGGAS